MEKLDILCEDRDLLVAVKPEGVDSEASRGLEPDMVNLVRSHLAETGGTREMPYVGVIQRLDRPVRGIMVFAKNPGTAAALSKDLREHRFHKSYRAILCGQPKEKAGGFTDWITQKPGENLAVICKKTDPGAKECRLSYKLLRKKFLKGEQISEVEIELLTGRHHQIRAQFSSRGLPLMGDRKYNPAYAEVPPRGLCGTEEMGQHLCLTACALSFVHPRTRKRMHFEITPLFQL